MIATIRLTLVAAALLMTSCAPGLLATQTPVPTSSPTPAPTSTPVPTVTSLPTQTAMPPTPAPSATTEPLVLNGAVWNAGNAASAQATELLLPDYAAGLYWPDSARVLAYLDSSFLEIYLDPLATGVTTPIDAPGNVLGIAPDGSELIYQGGDGGILRWSRSTRTSEVIPFGAAAYFAAYSPDGKTIAIGAVDAWKVTLYDRATMEVVKTLTGFETAAPVYSAIPGPNRSLLAWWARGKLQFQDIESSSLGGEQGYQDFITAIAFSPDGQKAAIIAGGLLQVLTPAGDGDVAAQDLLVTALETPLLGVVFSPDGGLVAAAAGEDVIVWETAGWTQVAVLPQGSSVRLVSFSPDGRAMVTVLDNNLLKSWRIP